MALLFGCRLLYQKYAKDPSEMDLATVAKTSQLQRTRSTVDSMKLVYKEDAGINKCRKTR